MEKIQSILIANRGEIAIRIAETARKMGIKTYGFLTSQEPNALYLKYIDEVIDVSENTFENIFMSVESIIDKVLEYKIDAVHPGYGFLSEDPYLAKQCEQNNITFIGPSAKAIHQMGNKGVARKIAQTNGIPVLPGSKKSITTEKQAVNEAKKIGYPVIIKAVAGGGGKGMRVVKAAKDMPVMFKMAVSEAKTIFNNAAVLIEKYVENPRHIEIQVLADKHENIIHLFERECSIQRKHQKLLEEAPSSILTDELREKMGKDAADMCRATGYYNAGTVEFLVDKDLNHYFMEMNTRIQVEHPVTEMVTGVDLVEQQILVAQGEKLKLKQEDIKLLGSAIELRINAEDVQAGFSPSTGIIDKMEIPNSKNLRCDNGFESGMVIPSSFDSLLAKLIIHGKNRDEVVKKAREIVNKVKIKGVKTTVPFFKAVLQNPAFISGNYNTSFIDTEMKQSFYQEDDEIKVAVYLAMKAYLDEKEVIDSESTQEKRVSNWVMSKNMRPQ